MKKELFNRFTKTLLITIIFLGGLFCFGKIVWAASSGDVVINEVLYDPGGSDNSEGDEASYEWVELKNVSGVPQNINDWEIRAGTYYMLSTLTADVPVGGFVIIYEGIGVNNNVDFSNGSIAYLYMNKTGSQLGNSKGDVSLYCSTSNSADSIIDYVAYGDVLTLNPISNYNHAIEAGIWSSGDFVVDIEEGYSLVYDGDGDLSSDWQQSSDLGGSPGSDPGEPEEPGGPMCGNSVIDGGEECDDGNLVDGDGCSASCQIEEDGEEDDGDGGGDGQGTPPPAPSYKAGDMVINEFVSDPADEEVEWVELFNRTSSAIELTGWTIEDNTEKPADLEELTIASGGYLVLSKGEEFSFSLNNSGDTLILRFGDDVIDQVSYGNYDDGEISDNAPKASDPDSIARVQDGRDTNNDLNDFAVTATPTKGAANIINKEKTGDVAEGAGDYSNDIIINEILPNPEGKDSDTEFIELKNIGTAGVDLAGWKLGDDSSRMYTINSDDFGSIADLNDFYSTTALVTRVIDGDTLELENGQRVRLICIDTPEKGEKNYEEATQKLKELVLNKTVNLEKDVSETDKYGRLLRYVYINGFSVNKKMVSSGLAKVFRYQPDVKHCDEYEGKKEGKVIISPGGFFVLYREVTGIALNNSGGDSVKLYWPNEELVDSVEYTGSVKEGQSYARAESNDWEWTTELTPGEENVISQPNQEPVAVINVSNEAVLGEEVLFDASDSSDPDGNELTYLWTFNNGLTDDRVSARYTFKEAGSFVISLKVTDSQGAENEAKVIIDVYNENEEGLSGETEQTETVADDIVAQIIITEFLPNPEGSDTEGEWIEIYNSGENIVDLSEWKLDDQDGGSRAYKIPVETFIEPNEYLIFERGVTKIALNNSDDSVRLINPNGVAVDEINYGEVIEACSYNRDPSGHWFWSSELTPGQANKLVVVEIQETISSKKTGQGILNIPLKNVKEQDDGDKVRTQGIVAVEPGLLGSQIFYLAGSGIQVYMYKKDFPDLELGDYIEVVGVLSESGGERRIKLSEKSDITILEQKEPPEAEEIGISDIEEKYEGSLIAVEGEVIETRGKTTFYLDDGSEEIVVYIKSSTGISLPKLKEGDLIKVAGILSETKSGYRLLPRYQEDVQIVAGASASLVGDVSGVIDIEAGKRGEELLKYLGVTFVVLIAMLIGLYVGSRKRKTQQE